MTQLTGFPLRFNTQLPGLVRVPPAVAAPAVQPLPPTIRGPLPSPPAGRRKSVCPYYSARRAVPEADIILAPYRCAWAGPG